MGREMGTVKHLWLGESWGLSHTCDAETAGACLIPVMVRQLGLSLTCDGERAVGCHTPVMGREMGTVTYL